ncbi:hypothetical protein BOX15_Mlig005276g1, partial [Macrostomum lignano]
PAQPVRLMSHFRSLLFITPSIFGAYIGTGLTVNSLMSILDSKSYIEQVNAVKELPQLEPTQPQLVAKRYLDQLFTLPEMRQSEPDPACLAESVTYEEISVRAVGHKQVNRLLRWASKYHPMGHTNQLAVYPSPDEIVAVYNFSWRKSLFSDSIVHCPSTVRVRLQPDGRIQSILVDMYGAECITLERRPVIYRLLSVGPLRSFMCLIAMVMP